MNDLQVVNTVHELKAQIETSVDVAKRYPRDLATVKKEIADIATVDSKTAESCFYALPRAGKIITGPSIRMAEIIAYSWQHIRLESRIVSIDESTLTCEAICWDMQRNVMARKSVQRKILNKKGIRFNEDMINTSANAGMAIAERNAIFKVIPMAVLKEVLQFVKSRAMDDNDPLNIRIKKCFDFCGNMKINREAVLNFVGKKDKDELVDEDLFSIKTALNSIKEGHASISELFYPEPDEPENPQSDEVSPLAPGVHETGKGKQEELKDVK